MKIFIKDIHTTKAEIYSRGITLEEFSKVLDISYNYLLLILRRERSVSPSLAKRIADELGKEIKEVFDFV